MNIEPTGTLVFNPAGPNNPDAFCVVSRDANAAAGLVIVQSPLPVVGTSVVLQITRSQAPGVNYQFWHTVVSGETAQSLAQTFADLITANTTLQAAGVAGQYVSGTSQFGVSHHFDDALSITAAAWLPSGNQIMQDAGGVFLVPSQAGTALDAGPQYVMTRDPAGWTPQAGSNVGQLVAQARVNNGAMVQYATMEAYIVDPDSAHPKGMWTFDTVGLVNGQLSIIRRAALGQGLAMSDASGNSLQDKGMGTINCTALYVNGVKVA